MARHLYRIGRFAFGHRWWVVAVWALILGGSVATITVAQPFQSSFSLPGSPSARAGELLDAKFPARSDIDLLARAKVVVAAPAGATLDAPQYAAAVGDLVGKLRGLPHVTPTSVADPLRTPALARQVNPDRTMAYLNVVWDQKFVNVSEQQINRLDDVLDSARDSGLTVEATGTVFNGQPPQQGLSEALGFAVALVVMIIAFASVVAATVPIITALVGVGIAVSLITGATSFIDMDSTALMLASMIGIAVSIDYSLFIVNRYRSELNDTDDHAHAAARAVGTAGSSVVFAGLTVVIALAGLAITGIPMITVMGLTAALAVVVAVCVATTLLPAVLGVFGRRAFAWRIPGLRRGDEPPSSASNGLRWGRLVVAHPVVAAVAAVVTLAIIAIPVGQMRLGFDMTSGAQQRAVDLIAKGFGPGLTGPLLVVADGDDAAHPQAAYAGLAAAIRDLPDVRTVTPPQLNADGSGALLTVIPDSSPSSPATQHLVDRIRSAQPRFEQNQGLRFGVTGQTAIMSDLSDALLHALAPYLGLVIGLAFVVLLVVFRSVLVPVTAALGFLLSVSATFGATVAIFQQGWFGLVGDPGPIVSFLPIFLIGVVFGLAMDYQVFLVTRMREEYVKGAKNRQGAKSAVITGFAHGGRVVSSAAVIMISVFGAFILMPDTVIKSMGFAMAAAVFFDAFLVRMVIIPAVVSLLGEKAWWVPRWLDRLLPNADVEGATLDRDQDQDQDEDEDAARDHDQSPAGTSAISSRVSP